MAKKKVKILDKENYLTLIKNSIGSKAYRNFYIDSAKGKKDILENGNLSCAYFITSILKSFELIKDKHLTVNGTTNDLEKFGWRESDIKKIKPGDIIIWEAKNGKSDSHKHIGFYLKSNSAISNSSKTKKIDKHHITFGGRRKIEKILTHKFIK